LARDEIDYFLLSDLFFYRAASGGFKKSI